MFSNRLLDMSSVGGSPGRSLLYISIIASSGVPSLSSRSVSRSDGMNRMPSMKSISRYGSSAVPVFAFRSFCIVSSLSSSFPSTITSPVSESTMSFIATLPTISSGAMGISVIFMDSSFLIAALVILLPFLTTTSLPSAAVISLTAFHPASISASILRMKPFLTARTFSTG